jgi:hypothetical protein
MIYSGCFPKKTKARNKRMRSSRVFKASEYQCKGYNPGFRRQSGMGGGGGMNPTKIPLLKKVNWMFGRIPGNGCSKTLKAII